MLRIIVIFCAVMAWGFFAPACHKQESTAQPPQPTPNPNAYISADSFPLDAEYLAEGAIAKEYNEQIVPFLQKLISEPAEVNEERDPNVPSYKISSQGKTYVIYASANDPDSWANATVAFFDVINSQLEGTPYRFYAIDGGRSLSGAFLKQESYEQIIKSYPSKDKWPYLPKPEKPYYGRPHD